MRVLYLDPGWDTTFGSFLWGEKWLGPRKQFIDEMRTKYGLKVSLHTPLVLWSTIRGMEMGPSCIPEWPLEARRLPRPLLKDGKKPAAEDEALRVPAVRDGHRNLALLPGAKRSSSLLDGFAIHQTSHLNDGWYGNDASWVAAEMPAWAEIDLGSFTRLAACAWARTTAANSMTVPRRHCACWRPASTRPTPAPLLWQQVAEYHGPPLATTTSIEFSPVIARWVRVQILNCNDKSVPH